MHSGSQTARICNSGILHACGKGSTLWTHEMKMKTQHKDPGAAQGVRAKGMRELPWVLVTFSHVLAQPSRDFWRVRSPSLWCGANFDIARATLSALCTCRMFHLAWYLLHVSMCAFHFAVSSLHFGTSTSHFAWYLLHVGGSNVHVGFFN